MYNPVPGHGFDTSSVFFHKFCLLNKHNNDFDAKVSDKNNIQVTFGILKPFWILLVWDCRAVSRTFAWFLSENAGCWQLTKWQQNFFWEVNKIPVNKENFLKLILLLRAHLLLVLKSV